MLLLFDRIAKTFVTYSYTFANEPVKNKLNVEFLKTSYCYKSYGGLKNLNNLSEIDLCFNTVVVNQMLYVVSLY